MAGSLDQLIKDLKTFEAKKQVLTEFRKEVRKPVPAIRKAIRARAIATLPNRGGLGAWVAKSTVSVRFKLSGRSSGITLKGSRKSLRDKSDLRRIDAGRLRAPSWGRRGPGQWHNQAVTPGFFTKPTTETDAWQQAAERAVDKALEVITRG
jgi:hypothetical protein